MWIDLIEPEMWPLLYLTARPSTDGPPSSGHPRISWPWMAWVRGWPETHGLGFRWNYLVSGLSGTAMVTFSYGSFLCNLSAFDLGLLATAYPPLSPIPIFANFQPAYHIRSFRPLQVPECLERTSAVSTTVRYRCLCLPETLERDLSRCQRPSG